MADDEVSAFLAAVPSEQLELVESIRGLINEVHPQATEAIKWNNLVFDIDGSDRLYIATFSEHVNLGFMQGANLDDPDGRLAGSGQQMRHVKLRSPEDLEDPAIRGLVERA